MDVRDAHPQARVVVLFRTGLTKDAGADYHEMTGRMFERARTFPGFVDIRDYTSAEGERLAVIWWESHETLRAWREDVEHRGAQQLGREKWFEWFRLEVCERVRQSVFDRDS